MQLISAPLAPSNPALPEVAICTDRLTLGHRAWRGTADDGEEFVFELAAPLRHGDVVFQSASARYVVRQRPEPVVEIALDVAPSAAAGIGWAMGNLHAELSAEPTRLLAPDQPAVRHLLERLRVPYRCTAAVFRPGRFARGDLPVQELGQSHQH